MIRYICIMCGKQIFRDESCETPICEHYDEEGNIIIVEMVTMIEGHHADD